MTNVINFEERAERIARERRERWEQERKQEEENKEYERLLGFFLTTFSKQPKEVQAEIFQAIKERDSERYLKATEPIIRAEAHREALIEINKHL